MASYYSSRLFGRRLERCYELAPPSVKRYLRSEIDHVKNRIDPGDEVLELGCGYGRVAIELLPLAERVVGIDVSRESLSLAKEKARGVKGCEFLHMDATDLRFPDDTFDAVICVQNGICAFAADRDALLQEALRVVRPGGRFLFSTYTDRFWPNRLAWFEAQAAERLIGAIDRVATGDGRIVCTDGFSATRLLPDEMCALCERAGVEGKLTEVDGSSLFCEVRKRRNVSRPAAK